MKSLDWFWGFNQMIQEGVLELYHLIGPAKDKGKGKAMRRRTEQSAEEKEKKKRKEEMSWRRVNDKEEEDTSQQKEVGLCVVLSLGH